MEKIDIQAEFKKLTYSKGKDTMRMEITPYRDWRILVIVFFVAITGALSFGVYMLVGMNQDTFFTATPKVVGVTKFDETGLQKVVQTIDDKAARFEALRTQPMTVVDPSI